MTDLSFSIPPATLDWLKQYVAEGKYVDVGDYLRDLLRREQEDAEKIAWLREQIAEGEASGIGDDDAFTVLDRLIGERTARNG